MGSISSDQSFIKSGAIVGSMPANTMPTFVNIRCDLGHFLPHLPEKMIGQLPDDSWLSRNWDYTCKCCKQSKFELYIGDDWATLEMYISLDGKYVDFEPDTWVNTISLPRCNKGHFCKMTEDTEFKDNETIRNLTDWYCNYCKKGKLVYYTNYTEGSDIIDFCIEIDNEGSVTDSYFDLWNGFCRMDLNETICSKQ